MKTISSRQNPIVRAFRDLADRPDPSGSRLLLDGAHLVREADASLELEVVAVAASRVAERTEEGGLARSLERRGVDVLALSDAAFAAVSPVTTRSGIVAIARRQPVSATLICKRADAFVLVIADVQDPGNLGSLLRVAEAGGVTGALVCAGSANPFSWKALRGSMGSALRLPVAAGVDVDSALGCLKTFGVRTVAAVPREGRAPDAIAWSGKLALLVGGEGPGLSEHVVGQCDTRVSIPMTPPVESLNVAVAGAILIYAARRYHSEHGKMPHAK
jgi:TrmH family RNA methyltransferase